MTTPETRNAHNAPSPSRDGCDIGAADGSNVAIVLHDARDRDKDETLANARLIAAAPDLLAACEAQALADAIAAEWDALSNDAVRLNGSHIERGNALISVAKELRRAAIAKATGNQIVES